MRECLKEDTSGVYNIQQNIPGISFEKGCERGVDAEENRSSISSSMLGEYLPSCKSLISEIQHLSDRRDTVKELECHSFADFLFSLKYLSTSLDSARFSASCKLVSLFYASRIFPSTLHTLSLYISLGHFAKFITLLSFQTFYSFPASSNSSDVR